MAEHAIQMSLPTRIRVKNKDVVFEVRKNGNLLGKLKVSKGRLEWTPRYKQGKGTMKRNWSALDKWMRNG